MISITVDTEWSPPEVIQGVVDLLDDHDVTATFFSTHDDGLNLDGHERALHPNFFDEDRTDKNVLSEIAEIYPEATGVRSHGLYCYSDLRDLYKGHGIDYESNYIMYRESGITPFEVYPGIVEFPIYFMDDMWMKKGAEKVPPEDLLEPEGFKIFTFHPIHVYVNSTSIERYERVKKHYHDPQELLSYRTSGKGVRSLFKELLGYIEDSGLATCTLSQYLYSN